MKAFQLALLFLLLLTGDLFGQSSQRWRTIKIKEDEIKYPTGLLIEKASLDEVIKILAEHTGAQIEITKPPTKNHNLNIEIFFNDKWSAEKYVWYGEHISTVKTYTTDEVHSESNKVIVNDKSKAEAAYQIIIVKNDLPSVEYANIEIEELLRHIIQTFVK